MIQRSTKEHVKIVEKNMVAQHLHPARPPQQHAEEHRLASTALENRLLLDEEEVTNDRLDPAVLHLVAVLFPAQGLEFLAQLCRRAIDKQLSLFQGQGETHVAVITFHGILDLVTSPGWTWGFETTLKLLQVLEALTVLVRFRHGKQTEIHIPLGTRPLHQAQMLKNLETCAYRNKKTRQLVDRVKTRLLCPGIITSRVSVAPEDQRSLTLEDRPELGLLIHDLLAVLKEEGVSSATLKRVALRYSTEILQRTLRDVLDTSLHMGDSGRTWASHAPAMQDDSHRAQRRPSHPLHASPIIEQVEDDSCVLESSSAFSTATQRAILTPPPTVLSAAATFSQGASRVSESPAPSAVGTYRMIHTPPSSVISVKTTTSGASPWGEAPSFIATDLLPSSQRGDSDRRSTHGVQPSLENRPAGAYEGDSQQQATTCFDVSGPLQQEEGDSCHKESPSSLPQVMTQETILDENRPAEAERALESPSVQRSTPKEGASARPSRIDYSSFQKESFIRRIDLEESTATATAPAESFRTKREGTLDAEALTYIRLLDGADYATPTYLATHAGKRLLGGYTNKLRHSPRLARVSLINTLMQLHFHETTKHKPLQNPGKWFHQSFNRYIDPDHPMEIPGELMSWTDSPYTVEEIATVLGLERQRQEREGIWKDVALHQPFASCVATYDLLAQHSETTEEVAAALLAHAVTEIPPTHQENNYGMVEREKDGTSGEADLTVAQDDEAVLLGSMQDVIEVDDPTLGWETAGHVDLLWCLERLQQIPPISGCLLEVLPTQYGRYVLIVTPLSDPATAWMWGNGRAVRQYLKEQRANAHCAP